MQGCQSPTSSNIENWKGKGDRWCHKAWYMTSFVQKILVHSNRHECAITQNAWKRCCWHCDIKFNLHDNQSHYYITMAYTGVCEEMFYANIWRAQRMQNSWHGKSSLLNNGKLRFIQEISYSILEKRRYDPKSGVSRI